MSKNFGNRSGVKGPKTPIYDFFKNPEEAKEFIKIHFEEIDKANDVISGRLDIIEMPKLIQKVCTAKNFQLPPENEIQEALLPYKEDKNRKGKVVLDDAYDIFKHVFKKKIEAEGEIIRAYEADLSQKPQNSKSTGPKQMSIDDYSNYKLKENGTKIVKLLKNEIELRNAVRAIFEKKDFIKAGTIHTKDLDDALKEIFNQCGLEKPKQRQLDIATMKYKNAPDGKMSLLDLEKASKDLLKLIVEEEIDKLEEEENEEKPKYAIDQEFQKESVNTYAHYIEETGLAMSFKIIFAEILSKKIPEEDVYSYTVLRLRQIGQDIAYLQNKKKNKKA